MSETGEEVPATPAAGVQVVEAAIPAGAIAVPFEQDAHATSTASLGSGYMPVTDVVGPPLKRTTLLFDQSHKLTTMPRGRFREFTQAAFWSAIATATSGLGGLDDLLSKNPVQPKLLSISEILIFGICVALTIVGALSGEEQTADEYLRELYNMPPRPLSWWRRVIQQISIKGLE